jgi:electron transport complex protein RnfA
MKELILIAIGAALVNNVVLSQFLGICAFLGVSKKMDTAAWAERLFLSSRFLHL